MQKEERNIERMKDERNAKERKKEIPSMYCQYWIPLLAFVC